MPGAKRMCGAYIYVCVLCMIYIINCMRSNNGMEPVGATAVSVAMTRLASLTAVNLR